MAKININKKFAKGGMNNSNPPDVIESVYSYPTPSIIRKFDFQYWPDEYDFYNENPGDDSKFLGKTRWGDIYVRQKENPEYDIEARTTTLLDEYDGLLPKLNDQQVENIKQGYINDKKENINSVLRDYHMSNIPDKSNDMKKSKLTKDVKNDKIKSFSEGGSATSVIGKLLESENVTGTIDFLNEFGSDIINQNSERIAMKYEDRMNPKETLEKLSRGKEIGKIMSYAAAGSAAGSAIAPGIGTAIGAAGGALAGSVKSLLGKDIRDKKILEAENKWSDSWENKTLKSLRAGYKDGGIIKGKGTAKSDSIKMDVPDGAFIVPAENADKAMLLGKEYLGWDDNKAASKNNEGEKARVSKGEVYFSPEEVEVLKYYDVSLDQLAPNAGKSRKAGFAQGKKDDPKTSKIDLSSGKMDLSKLSSLENEKEENAFMTQKGSKDFLASLSPEKVAERNEGSEEEKKSFNDYLNYFPEIASAVQMAAGARGLIKSKEKPSLSISSDIKNLSKELREKSQYGLEPDVKNSYLNNIETIRRNLINAAVASGAGSGQIMSNIQALSTTFSGQEKSIAEIDQAAMDRKTNAYTELIKYLDTSKREIDKLGLQDYYADQEISADLFKAGIANMVGSMQYKKHLDYLREVGGNSPSINVKKTD